jgi:hypothetical protein
MGRLAGIVATIGCLPAGLAIIFRRTLPPPVTVFLTYLAFVGYTTALAATEPLAQHSTFLLGKVV